MESEDEKSDKDPIEVYRVRITIDKGRHSSDGFWEDLPPIAYESVAYINGRAVSDEAYRSQLLGLAAKACWDRILPK
jgi:hypothetical protein